MLYYVLSSIHLMLTLFFATCWPRLTCLLLAREFFINKSIVDKALWPWILDFRQGRQSEESDLYNASLSPLFTILNASDADSISLTLQEKYSHEIGVLSHHRASRGQDNLKLRLPFTNVFKKEQVISTMSFTKLFIVIKSASKFMSCNILQFDSNTIKNFRSYYVTSSSDSCCNKCTCN